MSHMELSKAMAAVDTFLFNLWTNYKDVMLGHGARVDESGKPYVVVYSKKPIQGILPCIEHDIPIRNEVVDSLPPVPKRNAKYLNALICKSCGYEFAIISLDGKCTDVAYCPVCGEGIMTVKSIKLVLTEAESQFELSKSMKPLG